ncbi:hypothetical protein M422DRAFT_243040 [Sphaerobolus stellatus SS14]|nr:hypothetical protein M422DRAFT_243040 [Sphaerobolus stellatus SS14]
MPSKPPVPDGSQARPRPAHPPTAPLTPAVPISSLLSGASYLLGAVPIKIKKYNQNLQEHSEEVNGDPIQEQEQHHSEEQSDYFNIESEDSEHV